MQVGVFPARDTATNPAAVDAFVKRAMAAFPDQPAVSVAPWSMSPSTQTLPAPVVSSRVSSRARALQQINNQIRSLQNQAQSLSNEAKNLSTIGFPEVQAITQTLQQIDQLMAQARGIQFRVAGLDQQLRQGQVGSGEPDEGDAGDDARGAQQHQGLAAVLQEAA